MSDPTQPGAPGSPPPPPPQYGAPQYGAQPPPQYSQQPAYSRPPRSPAQTMEMVGNIVIIAGIITALCGVIAAFIAFAIDYGDTSLKVNEFLSDLALGLGLGSIAVAAGFFLKSYARRS